MDSAAHLALKACEHNVQGDDAFADRVGAKLAEMLKLRKDPEHRDRWQTTWGTKTNAGLARSVFRLLIEEDFHAETKETKR